MAKKEATINIGSDITSAKGSIDQLEQIVRKSFRDQAAGAEKSSKEISAAYKKMGIRTDAAIRERSANAKREFEKIKRSGTASAGETKRAHTTMTAKRKRTTAEMAGGPGKWPKVRKV